MKLRLKTKDHHDSERIRLEEQTFLRGLKQFTQLHCVLDRNLYTYTGLTSDIFQFDS